MTALRINSQGSRDLAGFRFERVRRTFYKDPRALDCIAAYEAKFASGRVNLSAVAAKGDPPFVQIYSVYAHLVFVLCLAHNSFIIPRLFIIAVFDTPFGDPFYYTPALPLAEEIKLLRTAAAAGCLVSYITKIVGEEL